MPDGSYRTNAERRADRAEILRNDLHELKDELRRNPEKVVTALLRQEPTFRGPRNVRYYPRGGLSVSLDTGLWHDKGAGQGGSLFDFVVAQVGSLPAAIDWARSHLNRPAPDLARPLSDADRRQYQERQAAALVEAAAADVRRQQEIAAKQREVAVKSRAEWERSKPAPADHPYAASKQVSPDELRLDRYGNLLAPMRTPTGEMVGVQRIAPDGGEKWRELKFPVQGNKMFPAGVLKDGTYMVIGDASDPTRPVAFAEGWATGKSFNVCTGLPVVVCWDVGNKEAVMTAWRQRHPDQLLLDAADNDVAGKQNAGAAMARHLQRIVGSIPILPQFVDPSEGSDWNDRHRRAGTVSTAEEIGAALLNGLRNIARKDNVLMPDSVLFDAQAPAATASQSAVPAAFEPTPRQRLVAAMVADGENVMGLSPYRALDLAQSAVSQLSDDAVLQHLPSSAKGAAVPGAVAASPPTTSSPAPNAPEQAVPKDFPMHDVLQKITEQVSGAPDVPIKAAKILNLLGANVTQMPELASNPEFRARVAYAVQDAERTGFKLDLPPAIRQEMTDLAMIAPGLTNTRMADLMAVTSTIGSQHLVQTIRDGADLLRHMGSAQECPAAEERVTALQMAVADYKTGKAPAADTSAAATTSPTAPPSTGTAEMFGPPIPAGLDQAAVAVQEATKATGSKPAEVAPPSPAAITPATEVPPSVAQQTGSTDTAPEALAATRHTIPSPGPGHHVPPAAGLQGQVPPAAAMPAAAAVAGRAAGANPGGTLFSRFLPQGPAERSGPAPWETNSVGLAQRLGQFGTLLADSKTDRLISTAEQGARAAMDAVRRFSAGPARELYSKLEAVAASEPGGMQAVMSEMRAGGRHEALRSEFTAMMARPEFARAYQATTSAIGTYAAARERVAMDQVARGLDGSRTAGFDRTDAMIGEEASKLPGVEAGKSHLEEMAQRLAEFFRRAIEKVASTVNSVRASVGASSGPSPSPTP